MDNADRWYFTKDQLANTPSRKCGISETRELSFRQQAANFIQDMGQRLQVNQLCINTAIVYMHRFYVFHSFTEIHRNKLSLSALFLAAKVEEQPRKLEHLIKVAHHCLHKDQALDVRSEAYQEKMFEVVAHENILLQTLGFVLGIEHPHTYVVKVCQLVKASKDLAQTSYIMATTSLHMTTMCLMYKPTLVACVCVHLACKWSRWKIEPCSEGRDWFYYIDRSVTTEKLEELTEKFLEIMEASPHRFKKKFGQKDVNYQNPRSMIDEPSTSRAEGSNAARQDLSMPGSSSGTFNLSDYEDRPAARDKSPVKSSVSGPQPPPIVQSSSKSSSSGQSTPSQPLSSHSKRPVKTEATHSISLDVYREKREKERLQNKVPVQQPVDLPHTQVKKPQHAFHESEKLPLRTSKHPLELPPVSNKERVKIPAVKEEAALDRSTSMNKINHQITKLNSDGSHHKERSSSHPLKIPHQAIDIVTKQEKITDVPVLVEKTEVNKPEKLHPNKSERLDYNKPERLDYNKPERLDYVKQQRSDVIKQERIESIRPEKVESIKQERVEPIRQEKIEPLKIEKIEPLKIEKIEPLKLEKTDHSRQERIDSSRHERVDAVRHEKVDTSRQERLSAMPLEKVEIKKEKVEVKQEKEIVHYEQTDVTRREKADLVKQPKVDVKIEQANMLPDVPAGISVPVSHSSHKGSNSGAGEVVVKKERREKHKKHSGHSSKTKHERQNTNHVESAAPPASIKVKIMKNFVSLTGVEPESSQKYETPSKPDIPKKKIKIKHPEPPALPKIIIAKDKSGTGQYITTPKSDHDRGSSRKRVHSNSVSDGSSKTAYDAPPSKHQKLEHSQKSHHSSASGKSSKSSRHSSHKSSSEHLVNEGSYSVQHPANGNNACNTQSYSQQSFMQHFPPPPKPPKMKSYNMPAGKTNANPPLPPPLPPQPPPPPPPE